MRPLTARAQPPYDSVPGEATREVKALLARGEMASATFSIGASTSVDNIEVFTTPVLSSGAGAALLQIDLHVVYRWQQAGLGVFQSAPVEVGELLLKDDRVTLRDGYVRRCGDIRHLHKSRSRYLPPDVRLSGPVRTSIAAGASKQFWLSIGVPSETPPGSYEALVIARQDGRSLLELPVAIEVLDVDLLAAPQRTMLWYRGTINCHHPHHYVRPKIFAAQLADIFAHGFRDISLWETDTERLQRAVDIAQSVGFSGDVVLDGFREKLWSSVHFGKLRPVAYVSDEMDGHGIERRAGHIASMRLARNGGAATMASVLDWRAAVQIMEGRSVESRPDVLSVYAPNNSSLLASGAFKRPERDVYFYWQAHMEKPLMHRVLAGMMLWKSGAAGISPYCYQHLPGAPNSPFDDFDSWDPTHADTPGRRFKDHMSTYPARHGVVHTLQWKGMADGITDLRYLATLQSAVDAAERSESAAMRERGATAHKRILTLIDKLPWNELDILSETSASPFPNFGSEEMLAIRREIVEVLMSLARIPIA